jgi:hypothetical protein
MAEPDTENQDSPISYARSSDFNPLIYTPITIKKLPKWLFPDVYPQYADVHDTPILESSPDDNKNVQRDVFGQDNLYVFALLIPAL